VDPDQRLAAEDAVSWLDGVSFATPALAYASAAVPLLVAGVFAYDRARRRQLASRLGELPVIGKLMGSASAGRRAIKATLFGTALTLIVFAAARPRIVGERDLELRGVDVAIAIDVSKSMLVDDVGDTAATREAKLHPSRLLRARELAIALIEQLPGDRIGPIVFAGAASHFPLTEDRFVAEQFLQDLGPADLPAGSNLAEVFRVARCLLRPDLYDDLGCAKIGRRGHGGDPMPGDKPDPKPAPGELDTIEQHAERGKAIVVFTDGADPDDEAAREVATAHELGIAVFIVGVGTPAGGPVWDIDVAGKRTAPKHDDNGNPIISTREDAALRALCDAAGDPNRYLIAPPTGEVDPAPIVAGLQAVTRGIAIKHVKDKREVYQPFLFAALMLLVIETALGTRRRQRFPEAA
jgi:Ca-activated chloride channel family protein